MGRSDSFSSFSSSLCETSAPCGASFRGDPPMAKKLKLLSARPQRPAARLRWSFLRMRQTSANSNLASTQERPERNSIEVFSTCSQSKDVDKSLYLQNVADVARWSEEAGCKGILVYTDNSIADP